MRPIIKRIIHRLVKKSNVEIARECGVTIGENCLILANPYHCFGSEPYLVEIGDHVEITSGCQFITHDGAVWTLRIEPGLEKIDKFGKIAIGNNVFIGANSMILPGVTIGNNCVIAAGSVVTKDVPSEEVWGGIPAHRISTLDDYKRKSILKADYTKGLTPEDKEKAVKSAHPEWFEERNGS